MHDAVLMCVLHGAADLLDESQSIVERERAFAAVVRDPHTIDQLHDDERLALGRLSAVDELDDIRVVQARENLALDARIATALRDRAGRDR